MKSGLQSLTDILILPEASNNSEPSWFGFIITIIDGEKYPRNKITHFLENHNIQTRLLFAGNLTKQPAFEDVEYRLGSKLTNTDKIMHDTFLIGVYPGLNDEMIDYMIENIKNAVEFAKI
ncbi:DegT/DnrJ/EryC1/StrS aminotransferase family protein [compost metagenome]